MAPINSCQALVEDCKRGLEGLRESVETTLSASLLADESEWLLMSKTKSFLSRSSSFLFRVVDGESTVLRRPPLNGAALGWCWGCGGTRDSSRPVSSSTSAAAAAVPLGLFFTLSHTLRDIMIAGDLPVIFWQKRPVATQERGQERQTPATRNPYN